VIFSVQYSALQSIDWLLDSQLISLASKKAVLTSPVHSKTMSAAQQQLLQLAGHALEASSSGDQRIWDSRFAHSGPLLQSSSMLSLILAHQLSSAWQMPILLRAVRMRELRQLTEYMLVEGMWWLRRDIALS